MSRLSRRKFIIGLAAVGGSTMLVITARHAAGKKLMFRLKDMLPNPDAAHEAGRLYLRRYPEENDIDRLVDELLPGSFTSLVSMDPKRLQKRLHEHIQKEFKKERTVRLDGWIISLSEARFYTLVHLALEQQPAPRTDRPRYLERFFNS